jgi:hypothetical protein
MATLRSELSLIFHLILVSVLILVWHQVPEALSDLLVQQLKTPPDPKTLVIISYGATIALIVGITYAFDRLLTVPTVAKWLRDAQLAELEGVWAQRTSLTGRPFSIGLIQYDSRSNSWEYSGVGYDENFKAAAIWSTFSLGYNSAKRTWHFDGTASILTKEDVQTVVAPTLRIPRGTVDKLTGHVSDIGADDRRHIFDIKEMKRISIPTTFDGDLSSTDTMRDLSPDQVRELLSEAKLLGTVSQPLSSAGAQGQNDFVSP